MFRAPARAVWSPPCLLVELLDELAAAPSAPRCPSSAPTSA